MSVLGAWEVERFQNEEGDRLRHRLFDRARCRLVFRMAEENVTDLVE